MSSGFNVKRFLELYDDGLSDAEIGRQMGFNRKKIRYERVKRGLEPNVRKPLSSKVIKKIHILHHEGKSILSIADELDLNYQRVLNYCKKNGLTTSRVRGRKSKAEQIYEYLEVHGPESQSNLIERFSVSGFSRIMLKMSEKVERIILASMTSGSGSRGGIKYGGSEIYGLHAGEKIWCVKNDFRIVNYLVDRIILPIDSGSNKRIVTMRLREQIGEYRNAELLNLLQKKYEEHKKEENNIIRLFEVLRQNNYFNDDVDESEEDIESILRDIEIINHQLIREKRIEEKYKRSKELSDKLKKIYGYKCQLCDPKNPDMPIIEMNENKNYVEVHHIIGFGKATLKSNLGEGLESYLIDHKDNVIVLCPYHHKLLEKYKAGFEYYQEKKQFISKDNKYVLPVLTNMHLK